MWGNHCQELSITFGTFRAVTDIGIVSGRLAGVKAATFRRAERRGILDRSLSF